MIIDTATNAVVGKVPLPLGQTPYAIALDPGGTRAYVAYENWDTGSGSSVIDLTTNTVVANAPFGFLPWGMAVNPAGTRLYVTDGYGVSVINAVTYAVVASISIPGGANLAVMNTSGTRLYVTGDNGLSIIDTATNAIVATADIGATPRAVAIDYPGGRVYVVTDPTNQQPNNLLIVDATTLNVVATVPVGTRPGGVAVDPTGARVYVTDYQFNDVSVVDTATNTVVATIPVSTPGGIVIPAAPGGFDLNRRGLTGSWFQPATSGQGVELEVFEDLVARGRAPAGCWFTYDYKAAGARQASAGTPSVAAWRRDSRRHPHALPERRRQLQRIALDFRGIGGESRAHRHRLRPHHHGLHVHRRQRALWAQWRCNASPADVPGQRYERDQR